MWSLRYFWLATLLLCGSLSAQTVFDNLHTLRTGDEIVYDFQQSITLIRVVDVSESTVRLRVVTATKDVASREGFQSWLTWSEHGCPGASTDEIMLLRTDQPAVISAQDTKRVSWLITLLGLHLTNVPEGHRRRAGPAPVSGELDLRHLWQPQTIVRGKKIACKSDAFSLQWPDDGSPLASRTLIAYFPRAEEAVPAFPYWIDSPSSSAHVSVVDSARATPP